MCETTAAGPAERNFERDLVCVEVKEAAQCWRIPRPPPPEQAGWVDRFFVTTFSLVPAFVGGGTSGESARSFRVKVMGNVRVFFESSKNSSRFVRRPQVADDDDGDDDDDGYSASVARRVRVW